MTGTESSRLKVAFLVANYPPEFEGGTERVVRALARTQVALGHRVLVLTGSEEYLSASDQPRVRAETLDGVEVLRVRRDPTESYGLDIAYSNVDTAVADALASFGPDVVHLHHWASLSSGLVRALSARGWPVVVTLHDMWVTCPRYFRRPPAGVTCPVGVSREACAPCAGQLLPEVPLWRLRLGGANRDRELGAELAAAHSVTTPSRSAADRIHSHLVACPKLQVVPHGLLESVRRGPPLDPWTGQRPLRVGTFGNLVEEKGLGVLLEAVLRVAEQRLGAGVELHTHGRWLRDSYRQALRARGQNSGLTWVDHGAYEHGSDSPHPARSLDLAVFPSLCEETYGLVVEEALARGVPVIVSDLGALGEHIGAGGRVTPAGDAGALFAAIQGLLHDPTTYQQLVDGIPDRFESIEDAAAHYVALYRDAAPGRSPVSL